MRGDQVRLLTNYINNLLGKIWKFIDCISMGIWYWSIKANKKVGILVLWITPIDKGSSNKFWILKFRIPIYHSHIKVIFSWSKPLVWIMKIIPINEKIETIKHIQLNKYLQYQEFAHFQSLLLLFGNIMPINNIWLFFVSIMPSILSTQIHIP